MGEEHCEIGLGIYVSDLYNSLLFFFFSSRRRHTRCSRDWSSDVCSSDLVELTVEERSITLAINEDAQTEAAKLDGCYVLKTDLTPQQANKEIVHDRYKDLASVEQAFRTCKTAHLEVRPIFLRREARTRAHAFVVMLAYQIIHYLTAGWSPLDITVEEGLHALTTLCLVEVSPTHAPSYHCIPTPRDAIAQLLHRADIQLPKAFSLSGTRVSTKKKLQSERLAQ